MGATRRKGLSRDLAYNARKLDPEALRALQGTGPMEGEHLSIPAEIGAMAAYRRAHGVASRLAEHFWSDDLNERMSHVVILKMAVDIMKRRENLAIAAGRPPRDRWKEVGEHDPDGVHPDRVPGRPDNDRSHGLLQRPRNGTEESEEEVS